MYLCFLIIPAVPTYDAAADNERKKKSSQPLKTPENKRFQERYGDMWGIHLLFSK